MSDVERDEFGEYDEYDETPESTVDPAESKNNGMICHLASFAGYIVPFGNIVAPLIWWSMKKEGDPFVDEHGKECINFQISLMIWFICCIPLAFVVIGIILIPILMIVDLIVTIIAALKAQNGEYYRYPLTIRFVK